MAKASLITALNLLVFALIGTALLAITYQLTHDPIARSEELEKLKLVTQIAPAETYDNDIIKDNVQLAADTLLGNDDTTIAYLGRLKGEPSIAVLQVIAPDGYSGKISLIISIRSDGKVGGVRVISHKETPGLGDYIEIARSKWITGFDGKSLDDPRVNMGTTVESQEGRRSVRLHGRRDDHPARGGQSGAQGIAVFRAASRRDVRTASFRQMM